MSACENPGLLKGLVILVKVIDILRIAAPSIIVITGIISFTKALLDDNADAYKASVQMIIEKVCLGAFLFFIPPIVEAVMGLVDGGKGYSACFDNANEGYIQKRYVEIALENVATAEKELSSHAISAARNAAVFIDDESVQDSLYDRIELAEKAMKENAKAIKEAKKKSEEEAYEKAGYGSAKAGEPLKGGTSTSNGNAKCPGAVELSTEPDPSTAINCSSVVKSSNFVYPRDETTGLPLGAWPKDYASIPTQLESFKTYKGTFIFPVTPVNGAYTFVYNHNGIDFMSYFGQPIYSPADGKMDYSEWGHTSNKGGDETSYSVSLTLDKPVLIDGKNINKVFMTHMSGIRYRCPQRNCNRHVQKGELIGFVGNAAGSSTTTGWAPHLHMSLYPGNYSDGLGTAKIEELYNIPNKAKGYVIKAGG